MRPSFITADQIDRWNENIKNDSLLRQTFSEEEISSGTFKELMYASLWLGEELATLNLDLFVIAGACYTLGQQSQGADPWQVAETILSVYRKVKNKNLN